MEPAPLPSNTKRNPMKLTYEALMKLKSLNGGWNSTVLEKLGVPWPPKKGWIKRIVDSDIPDEDYQFCLIFKDSHLKAKTIDRLLK